MEMNDTQMESNISLPKDLADLVRSSQEWLLNFPKAKTAKLRMSLL
jgi:hypothetical protein